MKLKLTQKLVNELSFSHLPGIDPVTNKVVARLTPNVAQRPYLVLDGSPNVAQGFGIRVGKESKTYIIQVRSNSKVVKYTIGRHPDLVLDSPDVMFSARHKATTNRTLIKERIDPNQIKRDARNLEILTFGAIFDSYVNGYDGGKANTLAVMKKAKSRLAKWESLPITEIKPDFVVKEFDALVQRSGQTAAEQTMRWANAAIKKSIVLEKHQAKNEGRPPVIADNPIEVLKDLEKYRTKRKLEADYIKKGVRRPISIEDGQMGKWLSAVWKLRQRNGIAADYLLTTLLCGARRSETAKLQWCESKKDISCKDKDKGMSYVDLKTRSIMFRDTKNRNDHELPISDFLYKLLCERKQKVGDSLWVFPRRSPKSTAITPHYADPSVAIKWIQKESGVLFAMHDLRRTFATIVNLMDIPTITTKILLNHSQLNDDTSKYAQVKLENLRRYMQMAEDAILEAAPHIKKELLSDAT